MGQRINEWAWSRRKRFVYSFLHSLTALPSRRFKSGLKNPASACADAAVQGDDLEEQGMPCPAHLTHPWPSASPSLSISDGEGGGCGVGEVCRGNS